MLACCCCSPAFFPAFRRILQTEKEKKEISCSVKADTRRASPSRVRAGTPDPPARTGHPGSGPQQEREEKTLSVTDGVRPRAAPGSPGQGPSHTTRPRRSHGRRTEQRAVAAPTSLTPPALHPASKTAREDGPSDAAGACPAPPPRQLPSSIASDTRPRHLPRLLRAPFGSAALVVSFSNDSSVGTTGWTISLGSFCSLGDFSGP